MMTDKVDIAIARFQRGEISLGRAAEVAEMFYDEFLALCHQRGIEVRLGPQTVEEFNEGLQNIERYRTKEKVRAEIQTIEGNCLWILKTFIKEHPDLPTNYAKAVLLYWREIDGLEIPDEWLEMKLSNPWSIGRLFSKVKKDFLGDVDKKLLAEKEEAWRKIIPEDSEIDDAMNRAWAMK